jgi:hypothetical protein
MVKALWQSTLRVRQIAPNSEACMEVQNTASELDHCGYFVHAQGIGRGTSFKRFREVRCVPAPEDLLEVDNRFFSVGDTNGVQGADILLNRVAGAGQRGMELGPACRRDVELESRLSRRS